MDRMGADQNSAFDSFYKFLDNSGRLLSELPTGFVQNAPLSKEEQQLVFQWLSIGNLQYNAVVNNMFAVLRDLRLEMQSILEAATHRGLMVDPPKKEWEERIVMSKITLPLDEGPTRGKHRIRRSRQDRRASKGGGAGTLAADRLLLAQKYGEEIVVMHDFISHEQGRIRRSQHRGFHRDYTRSKEFFGDPDNAYRSGEKLLSLPSFYLMAVTFCDVKRAGTREPHTEALAQRREQRERVAATNILEGKKRRRKKPRGRRGLISQW